MISLSEFMTFYGYTVCALSFVLCLKYLYKAIKELCALSEFMTFYGYTVCALSFVLCLKYLYKAIKELCAL